MRERLRFQLTYANVIATLALFVALGGSSYAALKITGRDVKNNSLTGRDVRSLTTKDVKNGSLLKADFAPGQTPGSPGYAIRVSPGGTVVCEGSCGGPHTVRNHVDCEPGERATGGGVSVTQPNQDAPQSTGDAVVTESIPLPDSSQQTPVGWRGEIRYTPPPEATVIYLPVVWAICASP